MTKEQEKYTTLDTEQCKWWVNTLFSIAKEKACNSHNFDDAEEMQSAQDKIIKALEQQKPMEKFENAKDHIYKLAGDYKCWDNRLTDDEALELCHILERQPTQSWIPVSERLPENEGLYLVSVENDHLRHYSKTAWFTIHKNWFSRQDVIAWQPLPQPYEEKRGDSDDQGRIN